jgi:hypothetical protein
MTVVLPSIFNFKKIKINISKKIDYFLYGIKGIFVYFELRLKIYLNVTSYSAENIDYLDLFRRKIIIVNNKFSFNLNLPVLKY